MDENNDKSKKRVIIYNRLFFKLYLNYMVLLLITVILICLVFINLYESANNKRHEAQLKNQAITVVNKMIEFSTYEKYEGFFEYYSVLEEVKNLDLWTISNINAKEPLDTRLETTSIEEVEDSESFSSIIELSFENNIVMETHFDEIYGLTMTTVAAPIVKNNEVIGSVILMSPVDGQKNIVKDSVNLIIKSSIVAITISFIFMLFFARKLSIPISLMRITALELANGNYQAMTNINRKDEIGDLAKAIDILSDKLLISEDYRREQEQIRQDFFANVSHELRTPITVIQAYAESLVDGVVSDEEKIKQYYIRMLSECNNMERLVGDLMLLSKMQNPDYNINKEEINIVEIFDDLKKTAIVMAKDKNISINIESDSKEIMILGDFLRLRQMFLIVIDNAIKFSEKDQNIYIKLSNKENITVSIKDEGIGMDKEEIRNIFDKFYKSSLRQNASGTGLGLAIANQISIKHDGQIKVLSKVNEGTEFIFEFPCLAK